MLWKEPIRGGGEEWGNANCIRTRVSPDGKEKEGETPVLDLGYGKCVTLSGADPQHKYLEGKYADECEAKCRAESTCYGFSYSGDSFDPMGQMHGNGLRPGNCLLWLEAIQGGGEEWGKAHCMRIKDNPPDDGGKKGKKEGRRKKKRKRNREGRRKKEGKRSKEG